MANVTLFRLEFDPYPMPRPRRSRAGGVFTPAAATAARARFRDLLRVTWHRAPIEGPVRVSMSFYRLRAPVARGVCPHCTTGPELADVDAHVRRCHPELSTPYRDLRKDGDGDNYEKFVLDACTSVLWVDDRQVISCSWELDEATTPGVWLTVQEVKT